MFRPAHFSFALMAVICSLPFSAPICAQSPQVPNRCTPPTVDEASPSPGGTDSYRRKVIIHRISFDGPIHLEDSTLAQIIAKANQNEWLTTDNPLWVDELAEDGLTLAWQDQGYFRVKVTAQPHSLGGDANEERFGGECLCG
jgi:hypothetical protein